MLTALPDGRLPVLLSAHAADLVRAEADGLLRYLRREPVAVGAVAQMLRRTRPVRRHRAVIRARDTDELSAGLDAVRRAAEHPLVSWSDRQGANRTAFVFPGQGNQWPGMGAELVDVEAYRAEAHRCDQAFRRAGHQSPVAYLRGTAAAADAVQVQAAQFTHAAALAATWRSFGVLPDITVGHSLGELAAAYTAGVIDLDAAAAVVAARAQLTDHPPGRFGMAMLAVGAAAAAELVAAAPGWLELSVVNGPESVVVSGELDAVRAVARRVAERGLFARELAVSYPAHTSALAGLRERMLASLPESDFHSAPVEFIGSAFGAPVPPGLSFRDYWYENLRRPVRFDLATAAAAARGATTFIEMSAHATLLIALGDTVGNAQVLGSTVRDRPAADELSANITAAAVADPGYRWRDFAAPAQHRPLRHFPHAPMRATKLWLGSQPPPEQPADGPVTLVEHWRPLTQQPDGPPASVAVIDYSGQAGELAARLTAALRTDPATPLAGPKNAELLVLVAPAAADAEIAAAATAFADHAAAQSAVRPGPRCRRVWLVTTGAEQTGADPAPRAGSAALAALHRSIGFGYPDHTFAHLDLAERPTADDIAAAIGALRLTDTEIAVRAGRLLVRRLRRCAGAPPAVSVPPAVLITGGTGAIGLACAAFCAEHGATDITLLSRGGAGSAAAARLDAISARTGARIGVIRCDLTDAAAVRAAVARHRPTPAGLVIHAASAPALPTDQITAAAVRNALGAKVIGLDHLARAWPLHAAAKVLVCSSVLALWGGSGHGLYAAANRMADALTAQLRLRGLDASSIRWGLWQTVAVVTGTEKDRIARVGLTPMAPRAALTAGLTARQLDPVICAADWDRLAVFFDSQGVVSPFERGDEPLTASTPPAVPDRPIPEVVAAELARVLALDDPGDLDMHRALVDLGLDSLLALDLRNRLGRATGRRVALAPLLAGITGAELVGVLAGGVRTAAGKDRVRFD